MKRLFALAVMLATAVAAPAQITTSSITGRVTTAGDTPLAGATVIAVHTPSATQYGTACDADGIFRISGMRVGGPYSVEISFIGCNTVKYSDIILALGETRNLDTALAENGAIETVVVRVDPFHSSQTGAADNFRNQTIASLPTVSRSIYDIARLSPHTMTAKAGGVSIAGANSRYNSFLIDGIVSNDAYGLTSNGMNGGLTGANPIPLDAIDEIQIEVAPFDVRQSGFTGGGINAVTKSGTNTFCGTAYAYYNDRNFYGTGPDRTPLPTQSTQIYGVSLGGAIVRDRLFFFINGQFDYDSSPSAYYAGWDERTISIADAQRIADRFAELTGYDGGGYLRRKVVQRSGALMARLDWNIDSRHNLTLRYNFVDGAKDDYSNSYTAFRFNGAGYTGTSTTHSLVGELNSRLSQTVFNTFRAGYSRVTDGRDSERMLPFVQINRLRDGSNTAVYIGTDAYAGMNALTQNVVSLSDDVSVYAGNHTVTAGTHNEFFAADLLYVAHALGTYVYDTMDDFLCDNVYQYQRNFPVGDPSIHMYTAQFGLYAQDEWRPSRRLTLTYGVRADIPVVFNRPLYNPLFNASPLAQHYGLRTDNKPRPSVMFSPRIGFRWTAAESANASTLLRGGVGLFTGKVPFVWITNCFSNTGMTQRGYMLYGGNAPAFGHDGDIPDNSATVANPAINLIDPDFRYPQVLRADLAFEQRIGGWRFVAEALFSKTFDNLLVENLVAQEAGHKLYAVSPAMSTPANTTTYYDSSLTAQNSSVYYLRNTNRGYAYSLTASAARHFEFGLDISAAYTFGHSYAVNDATSAQAASIWGRCYTPEPNRAGLSWSVFDTPHKVTATLAFSRRYAGCFGTTLSLVYQGFSGMRYTLTYYRNNVDVNGDSYRGNMPVYIPTADELTAMHFETADQSEAFGRYIESNRYLRTHRGRYAARNAMLTPFEHHLDLHLAQDFYFGANSSRKLQLTLDVINFGNMLSRNWGVYYYISDWRLSPVEVYELADDGAGNKVAHYRFLGEPTPTRNDLLSRWHMQVGLRVVF